MPVYKIRMARHKAENLHARLKVLYPSSRKGVLPLAIQAANDYMCVRAELGPDTDNCHPKREFPFFRRIMGKGT